MDTKLNRKEKRAVCLYLIKKLNDSNVLSHEDQLHNLIYILQSVSGIPLGFSFVYHKSDFESEGTMFSYSLRHELNLMFIDGLLVYKDQGHRLPDVFLTETGLVWMHEWGKFLKNEFEEVETLVGRVANLTEEQVREIAVNHFRK